MLLFLVQQSANSLTLAMGCYQAQTFDNLQGNPFEVFMGQPQSGLQKCVFCNIVWPDGDEIPIDFYSFR